MPTTLHRTNLPTATPDDKPSNPALSDSKLRSLTGIIGGVVSGILVLVGVVWIAVVHLRGNYRRSIRNIAGVTVSPIKPWYLSPVPKLVMDTPHTKQPPVVLQMTESEERSRRASVSFSSKSILPAHTFPYILHGLRLKRLLTAVIRCR
jgi:hypothetical protein